MSHAHATQTEIAVDAILGALEDQPASIREGTDPLVLLYWWKQRNPDTGLFMKALEDMDRDGLVTIGPPPERRLRLSTHGFAWLDTRLPVDEDPDAGADLVADSDLPPAGATPDEAAPGRPGERVTPIAERVEAVARIFETLGLPPGRGVEAGTLLRIWLLDGRPGAELRETLDVMAIAQRLVIARGARTTFALAPPTD